MTVDGLTCRDCLHFANDPAWLERELPGLIALSSAYGCARGEAGICRKKGIYLAPIASCGEFTARDSERIPTE